MEILKPLRYWAMRMSQRCTVTLNLVITVYNDMFDYMDGVIQALAKKKTQWMEDFFFTAEVSLTEAIQILC